MVTVGYLKRAKLGMTISFEDEENQWQTTLKWIKFMKLLNSEKPCLSADVGGGVSGIPGASSVIQAALTSHPVMLIPDTGGRYKEERHCVICLPASWGMCQVPASRVTIEPLGFQRNPWVLRPQMSREGFKEGMGSESHGSREKGGFTLGKTFGTQKGICF